MLPSLTDLAAERARRSLPEFVRAAWPAVEPGRPFVPNFHIDAICENLEAVTRGDIHRLLINVPPRHGKSLLVNVFWPAWAWITDPSLRWLYASYAEHLSTRDSVRTRRLVESTWYRERWGTGFRLTSDQNLKSRFENDRAGARLATSVGGSATGEGGDLIVVDDPHKIEEAPSATAREGVLSWFDTTMSTRLNDPARGGIVVIGQRLHERDLFGHLLGQGGWEHLCLPAEYEPAHPYLSAVDPRRAPGDPLWPERFGSTELARLKRSLGSYGAAGQLQQLPAPATGGIFKREWWRWYEPAALPAFDNVIQSWDLTFGDGVGADYVVGQLWGRAGPNKYLIHQTRERLSFTNTIHAIHALTRWQEEHLPRAHRPAILIEKAANGAGAIDVLKKELPSIIPIIPKGHKVSRAQAVSPQVEAGNVYLPGAPGLSVSGYDRSKTAAWVQGFVDEAASFPAAAFDDQVDAMAQALTRLDMPIPQLRVLG